MGTVCIYCLKGTRGDQTRAHVFPEALGNRDVILPAGTVCGPCNRYLGHELDSALVTHPTVAMALQYWGIEGKKGKPRKALGVVKRNPSEPGTANLTLSLASMKMTYGPDGSIDFQCSVKIPQGFRLASFRRALHHVAMNAVAYLESPAAVLEDRFNPVRTYVRRPRNATEAWSYADHSPAVKNLPRVVRAMLLEVAGGKVVALQLFQTVYAVDLLNSGVLAAVAEEKGAKLVGADVRVLPDVLIRVGLRPESPPAA